MSQGIQLNIQLPLEELGRFSHLLEQLQQLMAADNSRSTPQEAEKSPAFDPQRFQQLMQAELSGNNEVSAVPSSVPIDKQTTPMSSLPEASSIQAELLLSQQNAAAAQAELSSMGEIPAVQAKLSAVQEAPAVQAELSSLQAAPSVRA